MEAECNKYRGRSITVFCPRNARGHCRASGSTMKSLRHFHERLGQGCTGTGPAHLPEQRSYYCLKHLGNLQRLPPPFSWEANARSRALSRRLTPIPPRVAFVDAATAQIKLYSHVKEHLACGPLPLSSTDRQDCLGLQARSTLRAMAASFSG